MTYQESSAAGSSVYILKSKRLITTYLAALLRRKHLVFLISLLCLSFVAFFWYTNEETQNRDEWRNTRLTQSSTHQFNLTDEYKNSISPIQKSAEIVDPPTTKRPLFQEQHVVFMEDFDLPLPSHEKLQTFQPNIFFDFPGPPESIESKNRQQADQDTAFVENNGISTFETIMTPTPTMSQLEMDQNANNSKEWNRTDVTNSVTASMEYHNIDGTKVLDTTNSAKQLIEFLTTSPLHKSKLSQNPGLLLDTPGCKIPKFDPWDISVTNLIQLHDPYVCSGPPLLMNSHLDGSITLNETVLELYYNMTPDELSCTYQGIYREHEFPDLHFESGYSAGNLTHLKFGVPLNEEFVGASCYVGDGNYFSQYFAFVPLKNEIEEERDARPSPVPRLNVILVGIDSVSKLNFLRHFSRTRTFLKEKLSPFSMKGYTKVGDNTFPNLVPLLTGHFVEHYYNESLADDMFFDDLDLIWKDYAKRGYRTFYAEDGPLIGTFNYLKRGFYDPPTDYYFRTLGLALEQSSQKKISDPMCLNSQLETEVLFNYLEDFTKIMDTRPYIAFTMVSTITHDQLNYAGYADEPTVNLLEELWSSGALNNSALVLFSDHGIRYGEIRHTYIGKFEERMPFMYIYFPKWFLKQYPEIRKNLQKNQERLMTLFDIHATMIHLLDLNQEMTSIERESITLGSSLFKEISLSRTCEEANIRPHFCPCQNFESVPATDVGASKASQAIVDNINTQLLPFNESCAFLELDTVLDVRLNQPDAMVNLFLEYDTEVLNRRTVESDTITPHKDYLITLTTRPGGAVFEGTVRFDQLSYDYNVLGISRINMYGNQSICIDSQRMKLFCFCKS